jgi:chromosome segregation ATPase
LQFSVNFLEISVNFFQKLKGDIMTVQDINQLSIWAQKHAEWIRGHTADIAKRKKEIKAVDARVDVISYQINSIQMVSKKISVNFNALCDRTLSVEAKANLIEKKIDSILARLTKDKVFVIDLLESRLNGVESKVDGLESSSAKVAALTNELASIKELNVQLELRVKKLEAMNKKTGKENKKLKKDVLQLSHVSEEMRAKMQLSQEQAAKNEFENSEKIADLEKRFEALMAEVQGRNGELSKRLNQRDEEMVGGAITSLRNSFKIKRKSLNL